MPTAELTPPRLAVGSHTGTRAYGCAMNILSWENGDTSISDLPDCTAEPLARMIHHVNDTYCPHTEQSPSRGILGGTVRLLCAPCSVEVLDLAHRTVGTAGTAEQTRRWGWLWAEQLLIGEHGVLRHVRRKDGRRYVQEAAAAARRYANGETDQIYPTFCQLNGQPMRTTEKQALRMASDACQPYSSSEDAIVARHVNPTLGFAYLGVRSYSDLAWDHSTRPPIDDAHTAIDVWRAVMDSELDVPEPAEVAVSAPNLVSA